MISYIQSLRVFKMEFSCYYHDDEEEMNVFAFVFAKQNDIIIVELSYITYINGNLEEDKCTFFMNKSDMKKLKNLNNFYNLSLLLTEDVSKLVCREISSEEYSYTCWGISCRQYCSNKGFVDKYEYNYSYSEHPSMIFRGINDKIILKRPNKKTIKYYQERYEDTFDSEKYMNIYIDQEINKISKELSSIQKDVHKDIMRCNSKILQEVLPEDIVYTINSILVL